MISRLPGKAIKLVRAGFRRAKKSLHARSRKWLFPKRERAYKRAVETSRQKNWPEAVVQWQAVLGMYRNDAPAKVYQKLAHAQVRRGKLKDAKEATAAGLERHPNNPGLRRMRAIISTTQGDWAAAEKSWQDILENGPDKDAARARKHLLKAKAGRTTEAADESLKRLRKGQLADSMALMSQALDSLGLEKAKDEWLQAYSEFAHAHLRQAVPDVEDREPPNQPLRKVLVAGAGWSGSGAVYDYLREFSSVRPFKGEFRHIEGPHGMRYLADHPERRVIYDFFTLTLLGLRKPKGWKQFKSVESARAFLLPDNKEYAVAAKWLMRNLRARNYQPMAGPGDVNVTAQFIDRMLASRLDSADRNKLLLLDNVIHAWNPDHLRFIDNYTYLVIFRDPRSQFVSTFRENPRFHGKLDRYIRAYRRRREAFERKLKEIQPVLEAQESRNCIQVIGFEEFVLSESFRGALADSLGLRRSDQAAEMHFKPEVSRRNVYLHESFEDKRAIAKIEAELGEYCWNE